MSESHRSQQTRALLGYNNEALQHLFRESAALSETLSAASEVASQIENDRAYLTSVMMAAFTVMRNKRAALIYHQQRLDTIRDRFWDVGGITGAALDHGAGPQAGTSTGAQQSGGGMRRNMTPAEHEFLRSYADLVREYKSDTLDLYDVCARQSLETSPNDDGRGRPPEDVFVTVRVLKDAGEVETAEGARLSLTRGSQYYLPREDVETLVLQGYLEVVSG